VKNRIKDKELSKPILICAINFALLHLYAFIKQRFIKKKKSGWDFVGRKSSNSTRNKGYLLLLLFSVYSRKY